LVKETSQSARNEGFAEGYQKGLAEGQKHLRETLRIEVDFSLAQEVLDRLLFEEPPTTYVDDAQAKALEVAVSWRRGREMAFWLDVEQYLHKQHRMRMNKLRAGELHQKEVLDIIEGIASLPKIAARVEERYHGGRTAAPSRG
jgi:hypothetical protein